MPRTISVVIPTFRRPSQLLEAVDSVLRQQGVELDVLVLDDSPEGSAREAMEQVRDSRVRYRKVAIPSNGRPAAVRNAGWPDTIGEFVHFLDDDDRVVPGAYREMVAAIEAHPRSGMVFGLIEPFGDDQAAVDRERAFFDGAGRRARWTYRFRSRRLMTASMMFKNTMLVNSACLVRRRCIAPLGGYATDCTVIEDLDFWTRVMRRYGCVFLDRPVIQYRTGAPSLMSNVRDTDATSRSWQLSYDRYRKEYGNVETLALKVIARTVLRGL